MPTRYFFVTYWNCVSSSVKADSYSLKCKEFRRFHHGTSLAIDTHYTDTGGATDHLFALCRLLGYRFCPRLRDFPDRRLASFEPGSHYLSLKSIMGKRVKVDVIRDHWDEVVRLVASLKVGTVLPSAMLRKLAAYERQNQLDLALQEIGRVERTLFMLDWLESPACGSASKVGPRLVMLRYSKAVSKAARVVEIGVGRNPNQSAIAVSFQSLAGGTGGVPLWTPIHTYGDAGRGRSVSPRPVAASAAAWLQTSGLRSKPVDRLQLDRTLTFP